jgi:glycosyltransferase involved in cell wall biosynthesis
MHIRDNRDNFDAFIFVTYLYYHTIYGVSEATGKAYLISTAHDEPPFHLKRTLGPIFAAIKGLIYLSDAELHLIERFYELGDNCSKIKAGYGVEIPSLASNQSFAAVREKFATQISAGYFLYLGRASVTKLCQDMFAAFREFKTATGSKIKLLLGGSLDIELPGHGSDVAFLGFLSEDEKSFLLANAIALVNPSATESLSIVIQESWAHKRPVIINGDSDVMLEFCLGSGGGVHYHSHEVFAACFEILAENAALANEIGLAGLSYVRENCTWDVYRQALLGGVK